ncbi:hypothetical protein JCGZ_15527 [Jatropha curcas]|uniref:Uncharacterized protein n=1 Tax=Jatropha curcas TaxID=180498 RepID=A0A067K3F6_JATCU|nr:hypothetical protein JCGZ_15527 [Jatropha curcas]
MDWALVVMFKALFRCLTRDDWNALSPSNSIGWCEYSNFEAQKAYFFGLQTVRPDRRPFKKFTESMPIWYLKRPENYEDRRTGPGIFFGEFSIISRRILVTEEILMVPRFDVDSASMILPMFYFLAYEIPSYDFRADVVPLHPLIDRALEMDHASPYWAPLVCFNILSQYLLLNDIEVMAAFG